MSLQSAADIPIQIISPNSSSERRISPSWTIAHFKARLEPITGIPATAQLLQLRLGGSQQEPIAIQAADEDATKLHDWPLQAYAAIHVTSSQPTALPNYTDTSAVEKYTMPKETYTSLPSTVLSYKRAHGIGRFNPDAPALAADKAAANNALVDPRRLVPGARCRLLPAASDTRRGTVAFVGVVPELPGVDGAVWVGVRLDEPTGRNDGSVAVPAGEDGGAGAGAQQARKRYFEAGRNCGAFVRPERVEVGEFPVVNDLDDELGSDMEEI